VTTFHLANVRGRRGAFAEGFGAGQQEWEHNNARYGRSKRRDPVEFLSLFCFSSFFFCFGSGTIGRQYTRVSRVDFSVVIFLFTLLANAFWLN
jgi:hypothetical protein